MEREATDMARTNGNSGRWWALSLALGLALAGISGFDDGQAQGFAFDRGPQTPVSSDESEVEVETDLLTRLRVRGEAAYEGTGELAESAFEPLPEAELEALFALEPVSAEIGIESIIGADERVKVSPTTAFPARAVALVTFAGGRCTGWLYGRDVVATAGHCVHSGGSGGAWRTDVRVYPGYTGTSAPYGSCTAKRLHSVTGWTTDKDERYDYGAIKLNCTVGDSTGWFGYWWQAASLTGLPAVINGYPGDKPLEQWKSTDQIRVTETRQVYYANDTVEGMSGGPVYYNRPSGSAYCSGYCSMAIHAYGLHGSYPHSSYNHGTRIVEAVFNNLKAWKDAP